MVLETPGLRFFLQEDRHHRRRCQGLGDGRCILLRTTSTFKTNARDQILRQKTRLESLAREDCQEQAARPKAEIVADLHLPLRTTLTISRSLLSNLPQSQHVFGLQSS